MPDRIPPSVQPTLDEYLARIEQGLPGFMLGCYLHGSVALGEYHPGTSDVDFITVISRRAMPADIAALKSLHADLKHKYPQVVLSGSYLQSSDLGLPEAVIEPCPYYQEGVLEHGRFDLSAVTWWVLKHRGITLAGTPADQLPFTVDVDTMIADMRVNLNSYWVGYVTHPQRIKGVLFNQNLEWVIPGVLRQFYTFNERSITTKTRACEYALTRVPQRWHRILQETINIRNGQETSLYPDINVRAVDALLFLRYIIHRCNAEA